MFSGLVDKKTPHILLLQRKRLLFTMMLFITDCGIKRGAGAGGGGHEAESSSNLRIKLGSF